MNMKSFSTKLTRFASVIAMAAAAAGNAHAAGPTTFQFSNDETAVYTVGDTPNSVTGSAFGNLVAGATLPGSWVTGITVFNVSLDSGTGSGSWYFDDSADGNSLSGTFTATVNSNSTGTISYVVDDGEGLFAGAAGSGTSTVSLTDAFDGFADFSETGSFTVTTPVPEPSTVALMLAGLAAVGYRARRRKI
jgi:hypothetical protein